MLNAYDMAKQAASTHAADSHAADSHAADSHAADSHAADSHAADSHAADSHAASPVALKRKKLATAEIMGKLELLIATAEPVKLSRKNPFCDPYGNVKEAFDWLIKYLHRDENLNDETLKSIANFAGLHEEKFELQTMFNELMVELNSSPKKRRNGKSIQ